MDDPNDRAYRKPLKFKPLSEEIAVSAESQSVSAADVPTHLRPGTEVEAFPQFKLFEWKRISHADCLMTRAEFWILSNGRATFNADVQTSDADDVWLVRGLALKDTNGLELYRIPQFNGPNMVEDNRVYFFYQETLFYPAHLFPYIQRVTMYHHC